MQGETALSVVLVVCTQSAWPAVCSPSSRLYSSSSSYCVICWSTAAWKRPRCCPERGGLLDLLAGFPKIHHGCVACSLWLPLFAGASAWLLVLWWLMVWVVFCWLVGCLCCCTLVSASGFGTAVAEGWEWPRIHQGWACMCAPCCPCVVCCCVVALTIGGVVACCGGCGCGGGCSGGCWSASSWVSWLSMVMTSLGCGW